MIENILLSLDYRPRYDGPSAESATANPKSAPNAPRLRIIIGPSKLIKKEYEHWYSVVH